MSKTAATAIVRTLREHGHLAYFVGGCVRDLLLDRTPGDYDVATDATPDRVMHIFPHTYAVGAHFGVVLVPVESLRLHDAANTNQKTPSTQETPTAPIDFGLLSPVPCPPTTQGTEHLDPLTIASHPRVIEVATFRNDGVYSDGRHPDEVRFSSLPEEDVQRRDFTINGLLLDPLADEVLDYVGGRADLAAKLIRTIGDPHRRFSEDKLRLLRAVRFAARFGYSIEPVTFAAIRELAPTIHQVSRERIREELTKMLTEGSAGTAFELLDATGLLREVLPEIAAMKGVEQPPQYHPEGDVFTHTVLMLSMLPAGCSKTLAWGVLLHDVGKPSTFRVGEDRIRFDGHVEVGVAIAHDICERLRMSNDETDQIVALVAHHMRFADAPRMKPSTLKKFLRVPQFDEHLKLHRIDCLGSHGRLEIHDFIAGTLASLRPEEIRPAPLINGNDVLALGVKPGPIVRTILEAVENAQLDGTISTREQALDLARSFATNQPLDR